LNSALSVIAFFLLWTVLLQALSCLLVGYENLSLNNSEILKLLSQQQSIIAAYKSYYEGVQTNIDNHNDNREVTIPVPVEPGIADKVLGLFKD